MVVLHTPPEFVFVPTLQLGECEGEQEHGDLEPVSGVTERMTFVGDIPTSEYLQPLLVQVYNVGPMICENQDVGG